MSNPKDKGGLGNNVDPDKPYKVGNKKPPIPTRFQKGQSGNPSGRPKGRSKDLDDFGDDILMKEFFKTVPVSLVGKTVNKTQGEVLAMQMMKKAINRGTPERRLLLQFIYEARVARLEELKIKKALEGLDEIDWDAEREEVHQRLLKATAEIVQLPATDDQ
jgi:hypothetical protein